MRICVPWQSDEQSPHVPQLVYVHPSSGVAEEEEEEVAPLDDAAEPPDDAEESSVDAVESSFDAE